VERRGLDADLLLPVRHRPRLPAAGGPAVLLLVLLLLLEAAARDLQRHGLGHHAQVPVPARAGVRRHPRHRPQPALGQPQLPA
jgi:hypothetical protein